MSRFLRDSFSTDMVLLWAFETLACFAVLCALIVKFGIDDPMVALFPAISTDAIDKAMILSMLLGMLGAVLGLYTPALFGRTRALLATACIAAIISLPVVWVASALGIIDGWAILGSKRAWPAELTLVWIALLFSTRLLYSAIRHGSVLMRDALLADEQAAGHGSLGVAAGYNRNAFELTGGGTMLNGLLMPRLPTDELGIVAGDQASDNRFGRLDVMILARRPADISRIHDRAMDTPASRIARRALDVASASVLLVLTLPLMALTALAVLLESRGPLIYRQERVGLGGKPFTILKFRSMRRDAERGGAMFAQQNDNRVTRVGRVIRTLRIDELPQLINVLRGEMSMVGPRPERPPFVQHYQQSIPFYALRTLVKPGVTGWAQVKAPYSASDEETINKLCFDLYYLKHRSLLLDLKVMLATARVIVCQIGAR